MKQILLIDDDEALAEPLATYLQRFDLELLSATHPRQGLELMRRVEPDLVILDIMLPEMDGFEVCRAIRKESGVPIIMLTARGDVMDRVVGLELGADDYLPKPFEPRELVARIQNILRRIGQSGQGENKRKLRFGELEIDLESQSASLSGSPLSLTSTEFRLLSLLAESPGKPFSRDQILHGLRGIDTELYSRAVDIAVSRLRKKLEPLDPIKTVWGAGYSFVVPKL